MGRGISRFSHVSLATVVVAGLVGGAAVVTAAPATAAPQTFNWTGGAQIYVVPAGVTSIDVTLRGAAGRSVSGGGDGGLGATVTGTLDVTPGQGIQVNVGGTGQPSGYGGFNGGGIGGGGGGGASDIRVSDVWDSCVFRLACGTGNRWAVAGGGGAGGAGASGANGGGGGGAVSGADGVAAGTVRDQFPAEAVEPRVVLAQLERVHLRPWQPRVVLVQ